MKWVKGWYETKVSSGTETTGTPGHQHTDMMDLSSCTVNYNIFDNMDDVNWQELMADFISMPMQAFGSKNLV